MIRLESILRTFETSSTSQAVFDDAQIAHGVCTNGGGIMKAMPKLLLALLLAAAPCIIAQTNPPSSQTNAPVSLDGDVRVDMGKVLTRMLTENSTNSVAITNAVDSGTPFTNGLTGALRLMSGDTNALLKYVAPQALASLTDPAKLATLKGERAANPRLQKCVYWLAYAEEQGEKPEAVLDESAKLNKTAGTPYAGFLSWGLLENLKIAKELGLLTPEGMAELKRGKSATITKGQYAGQEAEADLVIPKAVCPELQNQVMNLELLPASLNRANSDKVTERAKIFAKELYDSKLLSEEGWTKVQGLSPGGPKN